MNVENRMSLATNIHHRLKQGMKPPRAAPIRHSKFVILTPLSLPPDTPSHRVPEPRLGPLRSGTRKSNFL